MGLLNNLKLGLASLFLSLVVLIIIFPSMLLILLSAVYAGAVLYSKIKREVSWSQILFEISFGVFSLVVFLFVQLLLVDTVLQNIAVSFFTALILMLLGAIFATVIVLLIGWYFEVIQSSHIVLLLLLLFVGVGVSNMYNNYEAHQEFLETSVAMGVLDVGWQYPWNFVDVEFNSSVQMLEDGAIPLRDEEYDNEKVWVCDVSRSCVETQQSVEEAASRFSKVPGRVPYRIEEDTQHFYFQEEYSVEFTINSYLDGFLGIDAVRFEPVLVGDVYEPSFFDVFFKPRNIIRNEEITNILNRESIKLSIIMDYLSFKEVADNITSYEDVVEVGQDYIEFSPGGSIGPFHVVYGMEHYPSDLHLHLTRLQGQLDRQALRDEYEATSLEVYEEVIEAVAESNASQQQKELDKAVTTLIFIHQLNSQHNMKDFIVEIEEPNLCQLLGNERLIDECVQDSSQV